MAQLKPTLIPYRSCWRFCIWDLQIPGCCCGRGWRTGSWKFLSTGICVRVGAAWPARASTPEGCQTHLGFKTGWNWPIWNKSRWQTRTEGCNDDFRGSWGNNLVYSACMLIFFFCQQNCHCERPNSPEISTLRSLTKLSLNEQIFTEVCKGPLKNKWEIQSTAIRIRIQKEFLIKY